MRFFSRELSPEKVAQDEVPEIEQRLIEVTRTRSALFTALAARWKHGFTDSDINELVAENEHAFTGLLYAMYREDSFSRIKSPDHKLYDCNDALWFEETARSELLHELPGYAASRGLDRLLSDQLQVDRYNGFEAKIQHTASGLKSDADFWSIHTDMIVAYSDLLHDDVTNLTNAHRYH